MKTILAIAAIISAASAASITDRIVGGEIAKEGQFPYEVSVKYRGNHRCGASILNEIWILTAAHCVLGIDYRVLSIYAGTTTLSHGGQVYELEKYIIHENFTIDPPHLNTAVNDIAVIKLRTSIIFNEKVQPIALNTEEIYSGADLLISGWGMQRYPGGTASNNLKFLRLKALNTTECQERFEELGYEVVDTELCAFANDREGACSGDSGSPLVYNGRVAGLTTWLEPCGIGYPDVYTRVSEFVQWVEENIARN